MTVCIALNGGHLALVDEEDEHFLVRHKWCAGRANQKVDRFYVKRRTRSATLYLHRLILSAKPGEVVDHKNGDPLDNRRANLRIATKTLNNVNRRGYSPASGYRGVYFDPTRGARCWYARITVGGEHIHLGRFKLREDAARAYDAAAEKHFGEFAVLNFPRIAP